MSRRVCVTRAWKRARDAAASRAPSSRAGSPLFHGTLYLANLRFSAPGGAWSVSVSDLEVVQAYLVHAAPSVLAYAKQYGPAALSLGAPLAPRPIVLTDGGYTDADLQQWVDAMAQTASLGPDAAILVMNPPGVVNQDAKESGGVGVLGYHGRASIPYSFVNLLGSGLSLEDRSDLFAEAVSHELAEMTVDPQADSSNPEVCDGCGTNCQGQAAYRTYFDSQARYLGSSTSFPPQFSYAYFISAIAKPAVAGACPAPSSGCAYAPP